jgi:glutamine amidotransferase PdxT
MKAKLPSMTCDWVVILAQIAERRRVRRLWFLDDLVRRDVMFRLLSFHQICDISALNVSSQARMGYIRASPCICYHELHPAA